MTLRRPLPQKWCEKAADEKLSPSLFQSDGLQLRRLVFALTESLGGVRRNPSDFSPALDLFCGTGPYESLVGARPLWSLDIDCHYGAASVLAREALPFADASLGLILCTQALYQVDDDRQLVFEMARVLRPGGRAFVSVPCGQRTELVHERDYTRADLETLFEPDFLATIRGVGGRGTSMAYNLGRIVAGAARRVGLLRPLVPLLSWLINCAGLLVDRAAPATDRPALWMVEAVRGGELEAGFSGFRGTSVGSEEQT